MSYSEVIIRKNKRPDEMSLSELRAAAEDQGLAFYKQQYEANPSQETKAQLDQYAAQRGIVLDPTVNRLYNLPIEKLREEFESKGKTVEDEQLDKWRMQQARTWIESQPAFEANGPNGKLVAAELERRGLRGSVYDLQICFDALVESGQIQPQEVPPTPVRLNYSAEELRSMPLNKLKQLAEDVVGPSEF
jgi:hypothetical protein